MHTIRTFVRGAIAAAVLSLAVSGAFAADQFYSLATASLGGTYYIAGTGVAEVLTQHAA